MSALTLGKLRGVKRVRLAEIVLESEIKSIESDLSAELRDASVDYEQIKRIWR